MSVLAGDAAIDLDALLHRLHLPTVRRLYPELAQRAESDSLSYRDFLALLMAEEVAHRTQPHPALRAPRALPLQYQTRHTLASLALQSGEQIGWVSKQLGHANDEMVIRHYAKFIRNLTRQDGSALARVMGEQGGRVGASPAPIPARPVRKMSENRKGLRARDP